MIPKELIYSTLDKVFRVLLGLVFIYASWSKIQDPALFSVSVANYKILPSFAVGFFALVLPMVELLAGLALIFSKWSREMALILLGMLAMFFIGLTQAYVRGLDISCGCFGGTEETGPTSILSALIRDVFLLAPTIWLVCRPNRWLWEGTGRLLSTALLIPLLAGIYLTLIHESEPSISRHPEQTTTSHTSETEEPLMVPVNSKALVTVDFDNLPYKGTVEPEKWTTNFPAALAQARAEGKPLILYAGARNCEYCLRMWKVLSDKAFHHWITGTGIYLSNSIIPPVKEVEKAGGLPPLIQFVNTFPIVANKNVGIPHIGVYWPRNSSNEEVRIAFCGRRDFMPGNSRTAPLLTQFSNAIQFLLPDYFSNLSQKPSLKKALNATVKHVEVRAKGPGTVSMNPPSGDLKDGSSLTLKAKPDPNARLVHWLSPNGKVIRRHGSTDVKLLKLTYYSPPGTYTAIFKMK